MYVASNYQGNARYAQELEPLGDSLSDMLKHARVFTARLENIDNMKLRQDLTRKMTDISLTSIQLVQQELPTDPEDVGSYSNEELNTASNVINKEAKKNMPKMKPIEILKAMHNAPNRLEAMKIGLAAGITQEQIKILIRKAPPNTPLGEYMAPKIRA